MDLTDFQTLRYLIRLQAALMNVNQESHAIFTRLQSIFPEQASRFHELENSSKRALDSTTKLIAGFQYALNKKSS